MHSDFANWFIPTGLPANDNQAPYHLGYTAWGATTCFDCPYPKGSAKAKIWARGYEDAAEEAVD